MTTTEMTDGLGKLAGTSPNMDEELLEQVERCISGFRVDASCPRCGKQLFLSDLPQYAYVCYGCDENFFDIEAVHGEARNGDQEETI